MEYELYHDETQVDGYWHGMLLVPTDSRNQILTLLAQARVNTTFAHRISFKGIRHDHGRKYDLARSWLSIGLAALRAVPGNGITAIALGRDKKGQLILHGFSGAPKCKFVLFRERDAHRQMSGYVDHASKVETTFRMGLKGGLHMLGSADSPITISKLHFDGHEHYKRHVDKDRIIGRLKGLREYCGFSTGDGIIDDRSSDHRRIDSQPYDDCQMLQLTDLLIGACHATLCGGEARHHVLAAPIADLIDRYLQGPRRMANSRWKDAFCMSQCFLEEDQWRFERLEPMSRKPSNTLNLV